MKTLIQTENLSKHYKGYPAVSNLSLNVQRGEIYGFLGLNGAGKTTTIRMLLGMIHPSSGFVYLKGKKVNPHYRDIWTQTGYLVEVPYAYPNLTVKENLDLIRKLRLISDRSSVQHIIDVLKLGPYANTLAKNLSLGNAQRLGLAKALIHRPEILILDEPSNGLDPAGIFEIRELLCDLALNHGVTIFISSHILDEVAKFVSRIGIINKGCLIQEMHTRELETLCEKKLLIGSLDNKRLKSLLTAHGYLVFQNTDLVIECHDHNAIKHPESISNLMTMSGLPPTLLSVETEDLESYFLKIIQKS